ncbi:hypothetical protein KPL70_014414 [Citrus sinensis]|nr:hypothetical protein KPL70_014414 [Citrus sinensis]
MLLPGATTQSVLREFATRFTGALRDWFDSLGNYRQLQFVQLPKVSSALAVIHDHFLGDPSAVFEAARRDYLNMKCCSLNAKDLDFHYKRMSLLFYKLNGFNEPTLKHVFLASLPDELQPDIQRQLTASNLSLNNISLGKIFQLAKTCLNKLCEQKQFFKELLKDKEPFRSACKKFYLQIKCKKKKDCDCSPKKKRHFKKFRNSEIQNFHPDLADSESLTDSSKRSHLLPEILNGENQADVSSARRKAIMPKTVPTSEKNLFDEPNDETVFALQNSSDDSDSDQSQIIFHQQLLSLDITIPIPSIKLQILPSKFQRPIPAIGLIDTESHDEHCQLLTQFYDIVQSYGIMLSAKKSTIAIDNIEFLVLPITPTLEHLLDPDKTTSLTWTLLEWFSLIPWWRKKLQQLSEIYNLERMSASEAQMFTSVFIIHRPYFQHPDTKLFWTQDQVYAWFTAPHLAVIENEIQDVLHNYLCQLNHQPLPLKDIFHTSLGPQHDLLMIPTPSAISKPKSTGIIIKEEKPNYTDFLFQDSQDPWEDFFPLSQHLQHFPQPSMNEPGSSSQPPNADTATKPSKIDKATQTSPRPGYRRDCPYPPCRGPHVGEQQGGNLQSDILLNRGGLKSTLIQAGRLDIFFRVRASGTDEDVDTAGKGARSFVQLIRVNKRKRMSLLFYKLNGFNEPTLKHVFLASLPDELQPDIQRQLTVSNLSLDNIFLGKIFQLAKTCLDKLCEQKQFFKELLKDNEPFRSACKKPYLQIKCKKKKDCDCSPKKKRHFKKFRNPEFSSRPRRSRKPYRFFRKKSSASRDFKRRKSSRCFICKKKGHYAKDCPNKREKYIRLVEHLQTTTDYSLEKDELEFYLSEQDEPNDKTVFALQNSSDDSDSDQSQIIFHQQLLSLDTTIPIPSIKLQILPSKFQRLIPAIGLIDTGAQRNMLNPHLLPPEYWTDYEEHFKAVNGKLFTTSLITKKPIGIQIFPNCVIWTKVIGSTLPNKDLLLGFDIFHQIKHLQIIPNGIRVKSMFKPFTDILKLYNLSETPQPYQDISNKLLSFCPESHSEFTHPNPLWKNKSFFIRLAFKLNKDIKL